MFEVEYLRRVLSRVILRGMTLSDIVTYLDGTYTQIIVTATELADYLERNYPKVCQTRPRPYQSHRSPGYLRYSIARCDRITIAYHRVTRIKHTKIMTGFAIICPHLFCVCLDNSTFNSKIRFAK